MTPLDSRSVVASWKLNIPEGEFMIEFEHGSTSGKRIIWINGKEFFRKDWMFRLVGPQYFRIGRFECKIDVEPNSAFGLIYSLDINGLKYEEFQELYRKKCLTWDIKLRDDSTHHLVYEKDTMDVWLNGTKTDCQVEFIDGGNLTVLNINQTPVTIKSLSSGCKRKGMIYQCIVEDEILQPDVFT